jgi:predicted phosphoribosyltransferase
MTRFANRIDAGRLLADSLREYRDRNPLVLAIPRGGVIVGFEVARALEGELDIIVPRKLGAPYNPELAIGAIMHDGTTVLNDEVIHSQGVTEQYLAEEKRRQLREVERRLKKYRGDRPAPRLSDRVIILVDDGVATGATMVAAARWARHHKPRRTVIAVPVSPAETIATLRAEADEVECLYAPSFFYAVGQFYGDFGEVTDDDVLQILARSQTPRTA